MVGRAGAVSTICPEKWESENCGEVERIPNSLTGSRVTSAAVV